MTLFDVAPALPEGLGARRFAATMALERVELTTRELARAARRYPDMAFRVSLRIYVQAARLFAKRVKYVPHPRRVKGVTHVPSP
jgi:DUF1365 family protein